MISFHAEQYNRGETAPPVSDHIDARVLAASTAERHTIPTGARYVVFAATVDFYANFGDNTVDAAIPSADVTDGSGSLFNPTQRRIPRTATHVSLITDAAGGGVVNMEFYGD